MVIDILTLSPGYFASPLQEGMIRRGIEKGLVRVRIFNLRAFTRDRHRTVDDRPFGGGPGMVLKPEPIVRALTFLQGIPPGRPYNILLTPRGRPLDQGLLKKIVAQGRLVLICGRYEGVDERIARYYVDDELSLGDYILTGGELAAMVVIDAVARLLPGVLGNAASAETDSFAEAILEYPQYTRPQEFRGYSVPDILLSGNHQAIRRWRHGQALLRTQLRRPDLFTRLHLSAEDCGLLTQACEESARESAGSGIGGENREDTAVSGPGALSGGESPP